MPWRPRFQTEFPSQAPAAVTMADTAFAIPQFPSGDANCWLDPPLP